MQSSPAPGQPPERASSPARSQGIERLLGGGGLSIDRLPVLRAIFEKAAADCGVALQETINSPLSLSLAAVVAGRADDIFARHAGNAMFGVFDAPGWKTKMVAGLSRSFVFSLTEAQLGGDGREAALDDKRDFSNIETHLAVRCLEQVAVALHGALEMISPVELTVERSAARIDPGTMGKDASVVVATVALQVLGRGGVLFLIIPQAALMPFRQQLADDPSRPVPARDPAWTSRLGSQISRAEVQLSAVIECRDLTLADIADLQVGQVLTLGTVEGSPIMLSCNDRSLFRCQLGQSDGRYTVKVDTPIDDARDFIAGFAT